MNKHNRIKLIKLSINAFLGNTGKRQNYIENHDYTHYNGYVAVVVFYLLGYPKYPPNPQVLSHVWVAAIIKFI